MFKVIVPKIVFKELEKIDNSNRQLVFDKIKDLEKELETTESFI